MAIREKVNQKGKRIFEVYVTGRDLFGKRIQLKRRGIVSLKKAREIEFRLKCEIDGRRNKGGPIFWGEWLEVCLERMRLELRPSTVVNYETSLKKWTYPGWEKLELSKITPSDIHHLIFDFMKGRSANTKKTVLKKIRRIFQMAIDEGILDKNPSSGIKVKTVEVKQAVLNASEVKILLKEAKVTRHRFYPVWAMALFTGMRSGELYALKWSDIDLENKRIFVTRSWCSKSGMGPTKSAKNRIVPISLELERLLRELRVDNPNSDFILPRLSEWTQGSQAEVLRGFCLAIGITSVKFHDLRATFITQLLMKGVPLAQVMAIVGHGQLKTTNRYLRITGSDLKGATEKLGFSLPEEELAEVISIR